MIPYSSGSFGFQVMFRVHGSAVYKAVTPAIISTGIFLALYYGTDLEDDFQIFDHPYPIGALIAALTFLLSFRVTFSYNRWWEAFTTVHQMQSKWLDVGMEMAAFHLQCNYYDKPPAFGEHPELTSIARERERLNVMTLEELSEQLLLEQQQQQQESKPHKRKRPLRTVLFGKRKSNSSSSTSKSKTRSKDSNDEKKKDNNDDKSSSSPTAAQPASKPSPPRPKPLPPRPRPVSKSINATYNPVAAIQQQIGTRVRFLPFFASPAPAPPAPNTVKTIKTVTPDKDKKHKNPPWDADSPPLFLQEAAHLLSLLSAVAMSTLRNDLEQADSPLISFRPGAPWPHVDPDAYSADVRKEWDVSTHRTFAILRYLLGYSRTPHSRTLYNAARPFRVIGGVSDAEIAILQAARGPLAKVAVCSLWLQEYISREYLAGSTGGVAPPIISRLYQFTSDGMLGYNQARKVAYIPFPFPHAQITSLFVLIVVAVMPFLMLQYINNMAFGLVMNILTVMCFAGLHEVSRELENPFQNVPNDVPLNNFQAQFNEALMTMFAGYHPDAFWEVYETIQEEEPETIPEEEEEPEEEEPANEKDDKAADNQDDDANKDCPADDSGTTGKLEA